MKIIFISQLELNIIIFIQLLEMSNSSIILASITLILTIYICGSFLFSYWFGHSNNTQHNIGCYVVNHPLNRTHQLLNRISDMRHLENMSQISIQLQDLPILDETNLHNKSVQLALSFQKYIKKITQQHDYNLQNIHILRQISKAQRDYLSCKKIIDQSYSDTDCKDNWKEYLNCSKRMNFMKLKLERLTEEQDYLQNQIAEIIKMPNKSISPIDLATRIYNDSMKANQKLKNDITNKLAQLENKKRTKIFEKEETQEKQKLTYKNYRQCQDSKKKHNACQQISKQVRNINSENIAYLKVMMESKIELLKNLQRIMGLQKNSKQIEELNQKYRIHKEEYKSMLKEFISLTFQNQKACGCTIQKENQLKNQIQQFKRRNVTLTYQIRQLKGQIDELNNELQKCEQKREETVRNYTLSLLQNEKAPKDPQSGVSKINGELKNKFNQILELKSIYKNIVSECDRIKERMTKRVHHIGDINDCISKKNYFLQLKKQTAPYIHSDNDELSRMLQSKKQLAQYISAFGKQ